MTKEEAIIVNRNMTIEEIAKEFNKLQGRELQVIEIPNKMYKRVTNGDMLKAMFPSMNIQERNNVTLSIKGQATEFTGMALREWWDAPYMAESEG